MNISAAFPLKLSRKLSTKEGTEAQTRGMWGKKREGVIISDPPETVDG